MVSQRIRSRPGKLGNRCFRSRRAMCRARYSSLMKKFLERRRDCGMRLASSPNQAARQRSPVYSRGATNQNVVNELGSSSVEVIQKASNCRTYCRGGPPWPPLRGTHDEGRPRRAAPTVRSEIRYESNTSRTFNANAAGVNGFCRKLIPASSTPCWTIASSV